MHSSANTTSAATSAPANTSASTPTSNNTNILINQPGGGGPVGPPSTPGGHMSSQAFVNSTSMNSPGPNQAHQFGTFKPFNSIMTANEASPSSNLAFKTSGMPHSTS